MSVRRIAPLISLTLFAALPAVAAAAVYSWKDADGKVHYGNQPPAAQQGEARKLQAAPPADSAASKAFADKKMADREKQQKDQEALKKTQEDPADARKRQEGCQQAKSNLAAVESGQVRFTIDAKGERVGLDGAAREAEIARARRAVSEWCSPPKPAAPAAPAK